MPTPHAATPPWTLRKSVALGVRLDIRCMRTESPTCLIVITKVTNRKPGSSTQKLGPKLVSSPGRTMVGKPNHETAPTRDRSTAPKSAAVAHPAPIASTAFNARRAREPRSMTPTATTRVTAAMTGAAAAGASAGTRDSMANPNGMTVTEMSAMKVPDTTGVMMRLSSASRLARPNWKRAETTTSVPSSGGPPATRATSATPIDAPDAPITVSVPAPIRRAPTAWRIVVSPPTTMLAKIAQAR